MFQAGRSYGLAMFLSTCTYLTSEKHVLLTSKVYIFSSFSLPFTVPFKRFKHNLESEIHFTL